MKVHPNTLEKLKKLEIQELGQKLIADDQIAEGDFKIEAKMSVVDINIGRIINDMLEQADLDLFHDQSDGKAS